MGQRRSSILPMSGAIRGAIREVLGQDSAALTAANGENLGSEWPTVDTSESGRPPNDDRGDLG